MITVVSRGMRVDTLSYHLRHNVYGVFTTLDLIWILEFLQEGWIREVNHLLVHSPQNK